MLRLYKYIVRIWINQQRIVVVYIHFFHIPFGIEQTQRIRSALLRLPYYPTLAREVQGFRVWGKIVFRTLELTATPTYLTNQVKLGHALDHSGSVQLRGPERAHQNNHGDRWGQIADFRQFWED